MYVFTIKGNMIVDTVKSKGDAGKWVLSLAKLEGPFILIVK